MNIRDKIQGNALSTIINYDFKGIVDVAPRVGKSKIAIDAIKHYDNHNILITAPFNPILESWEKEFQKWGLENKPTVINQRSLDKINLEDYSLVICDEVHTLSPKQREILEGKKILGFSGSISSDTKKILKEELDIKPIFTYSIDQAIKDSIISDYKITVIECKLDSKRKYIEAGSKNKKFKTTEYHNYNYLSKQFNIMKFKAYSNPSLNGVKMQWASKRAQLLYSSDTKINACKHIIKQFDRCLVFTARTKVADILGEKSYHSKSEEDTLAQFIDGDINKLAVCEMTSMGITIPNLKIGVFHQLRSSEEASIQKILRMCNWEDGETAEIYIFMYVNTKDEEWTTKAIQPFDQSKITFVNVHKLIP